MPLFSIIIPVYNKGSYLARCLDSVLCQTNADFEIILIDDGSTDASGMLCDEYAARDERIIVRHTPNHGVSSARNLALTMATGRYIQFVDADDYLDARMLEEIAACVDSHAVDIVFTGMVREYPDGSSLPVVPPFSGLISQKALFTGMAPYQEATGYYGYIPTKCVALQLLRDGVIAFDNALRLSEDYHFFLSIYDEMEHGYGLPRCYYHATEQAQNSSLLPGVHVDYLSQIHVQLRARHIILTHAPSLDNRQSLDRIVSRYIYCYAFSLAPLPLHTVAADLKTQLAGEGILGSLVTSGVPLRRQITGLLLRRRCFQGAACFIKLLEWLRRAMHPARSRRERFASA